MNSTNTEHRKLKIGITHGDINGIGYEVIIKTLSDKRINNLCTPIVYGSPKLTAYHKKAIGDKNFTLNIITDPTEAKESVSNIIECTDENVRIELGKATQMSGKAALDALERATTDLKEGKIDALLTAPINKKTIQSASFNFPGHTEYLSTKFDNAKTLMIMINDTMRVGVVTGHVPVTKIIEGITIENILEKLELFQKSLLEDFGIRNGKIAVLGLNPHASDHGIIGTEEDEIITPAIEKAKEKNITALGPFPADGFFGSGAFRKFDAILAMYHDQGLIPFKALTGEAGVNFTAGLPTVRTSPAHGTAFEIAGKGIASEVSFRDALYMAIDIFRNREEFKRISENPLSISPRKSKYNNRQ